MVLVVSLLAQSVRFLYEWIRRPPTLLSLPQQVAHA